MPKATGADKDRFRSLVGDGPGVEVKPMFGQLGAFVNGNMFAGLFGSAVGVKLDEAAAAELRGVAGSGPFGPRERPMGGYLSLPEDISDAEGAEWLARGRAHVSTLPAKPARR